MMMFRTGVLSPPGAPGGPGIQTRAIAGSSPPLAESVSEEEPLDDEMLALLDSHMERAADEDRRHLCRRVQGYVCSDEPLLLLSRVGGDQQ